MLNGCAHLIITLAKAITDGVGGMGAMIATAEGETVLLIPALNIDHKTAQKGLDILERCV